MNYSNNIILIIIIILNNSTLSFCKGAIIYYDGDGNKVCSPTCIAIFSLMGIAIAVAIAFCYHWCSKKFGKGNTFFSSSSNMITTNDLEQPTLPPSYDVQPPAYSELSNPPPLPPTLVDSESYSDAEEFYNNNNQPPDSLPPTDVIQELSNQSTYSSWKFIPEKILEQLEIVLINNDGRELKFSNSKKKGLKYKEIMVQSNLPFFNPKRFVDSEKSDIRKEELHYFEITVTEKSDDVTKIAIGLTTKPYPFYRMPGYNKYSVGYHSDNGNQYQDSQFNSQEYGPKWGEIGDTIGCGYRPSLGEIFFTKDGEYLGAAYLYDEESHVWYPTIGTEGTCKLEVNFGDSHNMFKYKPARSFGPGAQGGWLYKHLDFSKKWAEE